MRAYIACGACQILTDRSSGSFVDIFGVGDQNGDGKDDLGLLYLPGGEGTKDFHILCGGSGTTVAKDREVTRDSNFDVTFTTTPGYNGSIRWVDWGRDFSYDGTPHILLSENHNFFVCPPPPSRAIVMFGGDLEEKEGPLGALQEVLELVNYRSVRKNTDSNNFPQKFYFSGDVNGGGYEDAVAYDYASVYVYFIPLGSVHFSKPFVRGDADQDGRLDISDAISILQYLFAGVGPLLCMDAAGGNDDQKVDIA